MLTDLTFLNKGEHWPPPSEAERLNTYAKNQQLFNTNHQEVYGDQFKRIQRVIGNFEEVISYPVIINYQKKISLKTADLLLGEPPEITVSDEDSPESESIDTILEKTKFLNTCYQIAVDASRYGDGLFNIYKDTTGKATIGLTQPMFWFPIVKEDDLKQIQYHVLAWVITVVGKDNNKNKQLKVQIHNKGSYTEQVYNIDINQLNPSTTIIGDKVSEVIVQTGLDDFAVIQVTNVETSDSIYGHDDYTEIDSIVSEILIRVGQISKVLDKHAAPSVQGPSTALERDMATGEWTLKMGNYFPRNDSSDPSVEYIVWDANLDAAFKELEMLINMLSIISEMGTALFDSAENTGKATTGTAMRMRYISPRAKVKRLAIHFESGIKKALILYSQLGGEGIVNLSNASISVIWQDGIPNDTLEESEIIASRTGNKQTMSVKRALKQYDGLSSEQADEEIAQIEEETAASNPLVIPPFGADNEEAQNKDDQNMMDENNIKPKPKVKMNKTIGG